MAGVLSAFRMARRAMRSNRRSMRIAGKRTPFRRGRAAHRRVKFRARRAARRNMRRINRMRRFGIPNPRRRPD